MKNLEKILNSEFSQDNFKRLLSSFFKIKSFYNDDIELSKVEKQNGILKRIFLGDIRVGRAEDIGFYIFEVENIDKRAYLFIKS